VSLNRYDGIIIEGIRDSIKNDQLSHAYIIEGGNKDSRLNFAKDFCKGILCEDTKAIGCDDCVTCNKITHGNHEDIYYLEQSNKTGYSVEDIKDMAKKLNLKPASGNKNIVILEDAEKINEIGQNKMLKMLEEPSDGTVIILLTANSESLIETIISRCIMVKLNQGFISTNRQKEKALEVFNLINEDEIFKNYREYLNKFIKTDDDAISLLNELENVYRDRLLKNYINEDFVSYYTEAIFNIEQTRKDISSGMNRKNALKRMYIELGGK